MNPCARGQKVDFSNILADPFIHVILCKTPSSSVELLEEVFSRKFKPVLIGKIPLELVIMLTAEQWVYSKLE
jgi:hypothetical protein